jgi:hypothetical protein
MLSRRCTVCTEHIRLKTWLLCFVNFVILFHFSRIILHKASYRYPLETFLMSFSRSDTALFNCRQEEVARRRYSGCKPCEQQDIWYVGLHTSQQQQAQRSVQNCGRTQNNLRKDGQCTYKVILGRVRATTVAVEKQ